MAKSNEKIDALFIGAHQDDIEASVGGILLVLVDKGYKVEILDLTKRKGMYFSPEEEKNKEAELSAKILGVKRSVIDLGLLKLKNNYQNRVKIADFIRKKRPEIVITHSDDPSHPDHKVCHQLVRDALHYSYATAIKTKNPPWRVKGIYYFPPLYLKEVPQNALFVDISKYFEKKIEALKCYASQFLFHYHNRKYELEYIKVLNRYWGLLIKKDYAEVILTEIPKIVPFPEFEAL